MMLFIALYLFVFSWVAAFTPPPMLFKEIDKKMISEASTLNVDSDIPVFRPHGKPSSSILGGQQAFVSITTISQRISHMANIARKIFDGNIYPDRLFIFISEDPYLIDKGIPVGHIPHELLQMTLSHPLSIVYTNNIGPHRKLLPLLTKYWDDDVLIVTLDDEDKKNDSLKTYFPQLLKYYQASDRNSQISLRARRIGFCRTSGGGVRSSNMSTHVSPFAVKPYKQWDLMSHGRKGLLLLPTGTPFLHT